MARGDGADEHLERVADEGVDRPGEHPDDVDEHGGVLLCLGFREREAHSPPTSNPMSPHTQINSGNDVDRTRGGKSGSAKSRVADSRLG
jgi:hypothetical protein